ncbi:MAG: hypothetical protein V1779_17425 [bacterium]
MSTVTNTTTSTAILFFALTSINPTMYSNPYYSTDNLIPLKNHSYRVNKDLVYLKNIEFDESKSYMLITNENEIFNVLSNFSNKILHHLVDIEPEYSDILNKHFWELI